MIAQTKVMRIVQDANRAYAPGRLDPKLVCGTAEVETPDTLAYIRAALTSLSLRAKAWSNVNCTTKTIKSTGQMPVTDLNPFRVLPNTSWLRVIVSAQQIRKL